MSSPDEQLVRDAQAGSEDAFAALVARHAPSLYRFLHRRTGNSADAEDLVQRAFVRAHRGLGRFNARRPFAPWLFSIARNLAASWYRRQRPVREPEAVCDDRTPARLLEEAEAGRRLWAWARDELPEAQFTALWLRVEEGLGVDAIAQRMHRSPSNVKVMLHRARRRLAAAYRADGESLAGPNLAAEVKS